MSEEELITLEAELTDGEPYVTLSERAYIAACRRLLAEVRRLQVLVSEMAE